MQAITGMTIKTPKTIEQTEWNESIREKKVAKEIEDLRKAKLHIVCMDKGARMKQLKTCVAQNAEWTPKPTELDQLGGLLKMFGGMK